jgi:ankyrin
VVRCLVKDLGADINQAEKDGFTPLHMAAQMGNLDMVRCLGAEVGADVKCFCIAVEIGHLEVLRCFAELGADINQAIRDGATPF